MIHVSCKGAEQKNGLLMMFTAFPAIWSVTIIRGTGTQHLAALRENPLNDKG